MTIVELMSSNSIESTSKSFIKDTTDRWLNIKDWYLRRMWLESVNKGLVICTDSNFLEQRQGRYIIPNL